MPIPIAHKTLQTPGGTVEIPIYNVADVIDSSYRVFTNRGVGCYDLIEPNGETPLRVMTKNGIKGVNTKVNVIAYDSFNRVDNTTTLGMSDTGHQWQSFKSQTWGIQNNQAYPITPDYDDPMYVETGVSDNVSYTITAPTFTTSTQIYWRIIDGNRNYYVLQGASIFKVIDDMWSTMGKITLPASGSTIRVELRGTEHKFFVNDVLQVTFNDASHLSGTKFGISTNSLATRFDDVVIERL